MRPVPKLGAGGHVMRKVVTVTILIASGLGVAHADADPGTGVALAGADGIADRGPIVSTSIAYTGERLQNVRGGLERGGAYLDNIDLQAELDGERVFGVPGLKLFVYGLYDNGHAFDGRYVGSAQGISNIEADPAWRVFEAWADMRVGPGSVRAGLYNLNSEFDVNTVGGLFANPAHGIGTDFAQTGRNGPSIFPVSSLAVRYAQSVGDWSIRVAALDGVPGDPDHPRRTAVRFAKGDGALLVGEIERSLGSARASVGTWHYTSKFDDVVATDANGDPLQRRGSTGAYGVVEGPVWHEAGDEEQGLAMFLRVGVADAHTNPYSSYVGAGAVYTGALPSRPQDQFGIALAHIATGAPLRESAALAGAQLSSGETNVELAYRVVLGDGFFVQPNVQYVRTPGADSSIADAWVVGLRFKASWGWSR
jgi:porin